MSGGVGSQCVLLRHTLVGHLSTMGYKKEQPVPAVPGCCCCCGPIQMGYLEKHTEHMSITVAPGFARCLCAQLLPQSGLGVDVFIGNVADDAIAFGARVRLDVDGLITTQ